MIRNNKSSRKINSKYEAEWQTDGRGGYWRDATERKRFDNYEDARAYAENILTKLKDEEVYFQDAWGDYQKYHEDSGESDVYKNGKFIRRTDDADWDNLIMLYGQGDDFVVSYSGTPLNNSRKIKSARFIAEDENGAIIGEADTYEEAQTFGGRVVDTQNDEGGELFSRRTLKSSKVDFVEKGDKVIAKQNGKIVGFIEKNKNGTYTYAFGKPSQSSYVGFEVDDLETAKSRIEENLFSSRRPIKSTFTPEEKHSIGDIDFYDVDGSKDREGHTFSCGGDLGDCWADSAWYDSDTKQLHFGNAYFNSHRDITDEDAENYFRETISSYYLGNGFNGDELVHDFCEGLYSSRQIKSSRRTLKSDMKPRNEDYTKVAHRNDKNMEKMLTIDDDLMFSLKNNPSIKKSWWFKEEVGQNVVYFWFEHNDYSVRLIFEFMDSGFCYVTRRYTNYSTYQDAVVSSWKYENMDMSEIYSKMVDILDNFFDEYND